MMNEDFRNFFSINNRIEGYNILPDSYIGEISSEINVLNDYNMYDYIQYKMDTHSYIIKSINEINAIHSILMRDLLESMNRGIFRTINVRVGYHIPPRVESIENLMIALMNKREEIQTIDNIMECHYIFEYIHPYVDGNGRTGRVIWLWDMLGKGFEISNFLSYFSKSDNFYEQRSAYYNALSEYGRSFDKLNFLEEYGIRKD